MVEKLKFEVEFHYENLTNSNYSNTERHIIWKYKYLDLPIESFNKKERNLIQRYLNEYILDLNDTEIYTESVYKRPIKNKIAYNKEKIEEVYVQEESQKEKIEKENKQRFAEQRYTYRKKESKGLKKQYGQKNNEKELTYIEQIEEQRKAVKSQILNHL